MFPYRKQCLHCGSHTVDRINPGDPDEMCLTCGAYPSNDTEITEHDVDGEIIATYVVCPHCDELVEIGLEGDRELCPKCMLDLNEYDLPSRDIAHLYKGKIREILEKNKLGPSSLLGKFIRTECGPHCNYKDKCPQSAGNLTICRREYVEDSSHEAGEPTESAQMSRKNKNRNKGKNRGRHKIFTSETKDYNPSRIAYYQGGWFERVAKDANYIKNKELSRDRGSGSGT